MGDEVHCDEQLDDAGEGLQVGALRKDHWLSAREGRDKSGEAAGERPQQPPRRPEGQGSAVGSTDVLTSEFQYLSRA